METEIQTAEIQTAKEIENARFERELRRLIIIAFIILVLVAPFASAATLYVATDGNDNGKGTVASPLRTLAKAVSAVQPGDTIEMRAGTYAGGVVISKPGRRDAWITLKAHADEKVVIDGAGKSINLYFYHDNFVPLYWIMEGLEAKGGEYVVKIDTPRVKLFNNNFHGASADIVKVVKTANDITIYGNEIHHNNARNGANAQGVDIMGGDNILVAHNYVHDIPSTAMYTKGNASRTVFEYNRLENIYERGIMLGQSSGREFLGENKPYESYDGVVRHNTIRNTRGACLAVTSSWNAKVHNNTCENVASEFNGAIFLSNESELGQASTHVEIRNNLIIRSAQGNRPMIHVAVQAMTDDATLVIDGNTYWTPRGEQAVTFSWDRGPRETAASFPGFWAVNFDRWRRITGKDAASVITDPASRRSADRGGALAASGH